MTNNLLNKVTNQEVVFLFVKHPNTPYKKDANGEKQE